MLLHLHIQNYAIIEQIEIDFTKGLQVITGETGAGKSIIAGALSLVLGERADTGILRQRDRKAFVEAGRVILFGCPIAANVGKVRGTV